MHCAYTQYFEFIGYLSPPSTKWEKLGANAICRFEFWHKSKRVMYTVQALENCSYFIRIPQFEIHYYI